MLTDLREIQSHVDPIKTYLEAAMDLHELLAGLTPEQWALPTPCPGWSVADIVAHLIDLDDMAVGNARPEQLAHTVDWDALPHVQNAGQRFTEQGVDFRRGTDPQVLSAQFFKAVNALVDFLTIGGDSVAPDISVPWVKNALPVEQFLSMRTFDMWTHEQDIRTAINTPGNLGTNPARATLARMVSSLPFIWGKKVAPPQGESLTLTLTQELPGSTSVVINADGKAEFTGTVASVDQTSRNVVVMTWPDFAHAFAGRVSPDVTRENAKLTGTYAHAFLEALNSTP